MEAIKIQDERPYEHINGADYPVAQASIRHALIIKYLISILDKYIENNNGKCIVFSSNLTVFIHGHEDDWVYPDISIICDHDKLKKDNGCHGAPDMIIEVVSKFNRSKDYKRNPLLYANAGVKEYWIVDTFKRAVTVHLNTKPAPDDYIEYSFDDNILVGIFENKLSICIGE